MTELGTKSEVGEGILGIARDPPFSFPAAATPTRHNPLSLLHSSSSSSRSSPLTHQRSSNSSGISPPTAAKPHPFDHPPNQFQFVRFWGDFWRFLTRSWRVWGAESGLERMLRYGHSIPLLIAPISYEFRLFQTPIEPQFRK